MKYKAGILDGIKRLAKGYWCASPYWKTCQLDCGDCNMLRKKDEKYEKNE